MECCIGTAVSHRRLSPARCRCCCCSDPMTDSVPSEVGGHHERRTTIHGCGEHCTRQWLRTTIGAGRRSRLSILFDPGCGELSGHAVLQAGAQIAVFSNTRSRPRGMRATVSYSRNPNRAPSLRMPLETAVPVKKKLNGGDGRARSLLRARSMFG